MRTVAGATGSRSLTPMCHRPYVWSLNADSNGSATPPAGRSPPPPSPVGAPVSSSSSLRLGSRRISCWTRSRRRSAPPWLKRTNGGAMRSTRSCMSRSARRYLPTCRSPGASAFTSRIAAAMQTLLGADAERTRRTSRTTCSSPVRPCRVRRRSTFLSTQLATRSRRSRRRTRFATSPRRCTSWVIATRHDVRSCLPYRRAPATRRHTSTTRSAISPARSRLLRPVRRVMRSCASGRVSSSTCSTGRPPRPTSSRCSRQREHEVIAPPSSTPCSALGRAHYVRALDDQGFAPLTRATYEEAYELAAEQGDSRAMIEALLPTVWFTDYWVDYAPVARANIEEAGRLADALGDEQLSLEVEAASLRFVRGPEAAELVERLRERLEARHDPVRLKEHYFWLMWHYLGRGELLRCVQTCDLGIELARQLGSAPVQYGSIKALALTELGRYDLVDAALDEEVTDDEHPFGRANQAFARRATSARSRRGSRRLWLRSTRCSGAPHCRGCGCRRACSRSSPRSVHTARPDGGSDGGDRRHWRCERDPPDRHRTR